MKLSTVFAAAFLLAVTLAPVGAVSPVTHSATRFSLTPVINYSHYVSGSDLTGEEREFIARINTDRRERGLYSLIPDFQLVQVARAHSYDMCARNYFSHFAPSAPMRSPMNRYLALLNSTGFPIPDHLTVGENIYYCSGMRMGNEVAYAHQALMNSLEHRDNILNPSYERIGVGVWRDGKGQLWVTENFLNTSE